MTTICLISVYPDVIHRRFQIIKVPKLVAIDRAGSKSFRCGIFIQEWSFRGKILSLVGTWNHHLIGKNSCNSHSDVQLCAHCVDCGYQDGYAGRLSLSRSTVCGVDYASEVLKVYTTSNNKINTSLVQTGHPNKYNVRPGPYTFSKILSNLWIGWICDADAPKILSDCPFSSLSCSSIISSREKKNSPSSRTT